MGLGFGKWLIKSAKANKRNKASKEIFKQATDDGGPFVRRKMHQIKKSQKKGDVYTKPGHIVGTPTKERSAESIKKYHGIK